MVRTITATLSLPPSANAIWRIANNRIFKTQKAKNWQEEAAFELKMASRRCPVDFDLVSVVTNIWWGDNRRHDASNIEKLLFDAIEESGIIEDDKNIIDHRTVVKGVDKENPRLEMEISKYLAH